MADASSRDRAIDALVSLMGKLHAGWGAPPGDYADVVNWIITAAAEEAEARVADHYEAQLKEIEDSLQEAAEASQTDLRDEFAMAALTGLVATESPDCAARAAYEYADVMLAARGESNG